MTTPEELIAGMDEAGRGSWAGPVAAAAVILPKGFRLPGLTDSKLLSTAKREAFFEVIVRKCDHGIGFATHEEVDSLGLIRATELAFLRALEGLKQRPTLLLVDGRDRFHFQVPHQSIIKGDQKVRSISAASVLAKVSRDRHMQALSEEFPDYGFAIHKGYGTRLHQNRLKTHGPSPLHRLSFEPIQNLACK